MKLFKNFLYIILSVASLGIIGIYGSCPGVDLSYTGNVLQGNLNQFSAMPALGMYSPDGKYIVVPKGFGNSTNIGYYDSQTFAQVGQVSENLIRDITFSPDQKYIAVTYPGLNAGGRIIVFDPTAITPTTYTFGLSGFQGYMNQIGYSPDGKYLAISIVPTSGGLNPAVYIYDVSNFASTHTLDYVTKIAGYSFGWSPDGTKIAVGSTTVIEYDIYTFVQSANQSIAIQNLNTYLQAAGITSVNGIYNIKYSPDGISLAIAIYDNTNQCYIYLYDTSKAVLDNCTSGNRFVCQGSNPYIISIGSQSTSSILSNIPTNITNLSYSPNSRYLLFNYVNNSIGCYDSLSECLNSNTSLNYPSNAYTGNLVSVSFAPDSSAVSVGGITTTSSIYGSGYNFLNVFNNSTSGADSVSLNPYFSPLCNSATGVNLSLTGYPLGSSFIWTGPSGTAGTTSSITATTSGLYTAKFTSGSYSGGASKLVYVNSSPLITQQPQNDTVNLGNTATFIINAVSPDLNIQWQVIPNGTTGAIDITGATGNSYSLVAEPSDNGNQYQAVLSNGQYPYCSTTSNTGLLTLNGYISPYTQTTLCGSTGIQFTAFSSAANPTYQWQSSTDNATFSNITGATSSTYTVNTAGYYRCIINGTASNSTQVVQLAATITPSYVNIQANHFTTLTANVTPSGTYTYQWYKDNSAISGATSQTYSASTAGSYTVVVTDASNCSVTSSPSTVNTYIKPSCTMQFSSSGCVFSNLGGQSIAYSPDSQYIAVSEQASSNVNYASVYNKAGALVGNTCSFSAPFTAIGFSPDQKYIAAAAAYSGAVFVQIFDFTQSATTPCLTTGTGYPIASSIEVQNVSHVTQCLFSPDGQRIGIIAVNNSFVPNLYIYNVSDILNPVLETTLINSGTGYTSFDWSPDGTNVLVTRTIGFGSTLTFQIQQISVPAYQVTQTYDLSTVFNTFTLNGYPRGVSGLKYSADGTILSGILMTSTNEQYAFVYYLNFGLNPYNNYGVGGNPSLIDIGSAPAYLNNNLTVMPTNYPSTTFASNGLYALYGTNSGTIGCFDLSANTSINVTNTTNYNISLPCSLVANNPILSMAMSPDSSTFTAFSNFSSTAGYLTIYNNKTCFDQTSSITPNFAATCNASTGVDLTLNGAPSGSSYSWAGPNSFSGYSATVTAPTSGLYTANFTSLTGLLGGNSKLVYVNSTPVITQQPVNQYIEPGNTATFTVGATSPNLAIQWQRLINNAWTNITGATGSTYSFTGQASDSASEYQAYLTNTQYPLCATESNSAVLYIGGTIIPTTPVTICQNNTQTFTAISNTPSSTYQWQSSLDNVNFVNIGGAIASTYTTDSTGYYRCIINGVASNSTQLTVDVTVTPEIYPAGAIQICQGSTQTLSVTGNYTGSDIYHWFQNGVFIGSGASINTSSEGSYTVQSVDPNGCTSTESAPTTISYAVTGCSTGSTGCTGVSCDIILSVDPTIASVALGGSQTFTATILSGTATLIEWFGPNNFYATGNSITISNISSSDIGLYYCTASNATNKVTVTVQLTEQSTISATITTANNMTVAGASVTLTVATFGGSGSYTYSWSGPNNFSLVTSQSSLSLDSISIDNAGQYTVKVVDTAGNITYTSINLIVVNPETINSQMQLNDKSKMVLVGSTSQVTVYGGHGPYSYTWAYAKIYPVQDSTLTAVQGNYVDNAFSFPVIDIVNNTSGSTASNFNYAQTATIPNNFSGKIVGQSSTNVHLQTTNVNGVYTSENSSSVDMAVEQSYQYPITHGFTLVCIVSDSNGHSCPVLMPFTQKVDMSSELEGKYSYFLANSTTKSKEVPGFFKSVKRGQTRVQPAFSSAFGTLAQGGFATESQLQQNAEKKARCIKIVICVIVGVLVLAAIIASLFIPGVGGAIGGALTSLGEEGSFIGAGALAAEKSAELAALIASGASTAEISAATLIANAAAATASIATTYIGTIIVMSSIVVSLTLGVTLQAGLNK